MDPVMFLRALLLVFVVVCVPVTAQAVTVRDIIELSKAGLSDDVLVALIDADRTIFTLDAEQILDLKRAGIGEKVLLKMLATRREFEPAPNANASGYDAPNGQAASSPPQVVVIGGTPAPPTTVTVVVPQFVPVAIWGTFDGYRRRDHAPVIVDTDRGFGRFLNDGWIGSRISRGTPWQMPPMNPFPRP